MNHQAFEYGENKIGIPDDVLQDVLQEVGNIFKKNNSENKFGLCIIGEPDKHSVLLETTDEKNRIQTIQKVDKKSLSGISGNKVETVWSLDNESSKVCVSVCINDEGHSTTHSEREQ